MKRKRNAKALCMKDEMGSQKHQPSQDWGNAASKNTNSDIFALLIY